MSKAQGNFDFLVHHPFKAGWILWLAVFIVISLAAWNKIVIKVIKISFFCVVIIQLWCGLWCGVLFFYI